MELFNGQGNGGDLLHEFRADLVSDCATARAGHEHAGILPTDAHLGFHAFEEFQRFLGLFCFVPLVVLPQNAVRGLIHDYRFDGGGAHVQSNQEFRDVTMGLRGVRELPHLRPEWKNLNQLRSSVVVHCFLAARKSDSGALAEANGLSGTEVPRSHE
jgi:hypothetical protein